MLLSEGIPLSKIGGDASYHGGLRAQLEEKQYSLGSRATLSAYIPLVLQQEKESIKSELTSPAKQGDLSLCTSVAVPGALQGETMHHRCVSVIFDGSTNVAEVYAIVARFVTDDFFIQQRIIGLHHLRASLNAEQISQTLTEAINDNFNVPLVAVLAFMHDRAAVNIKALKDMQIFYRNAERIGCLSHSISNAGKLFNNTETHTAFEFVKKWRAIISRSPLARVLFETQTGQKAKRANMTRWYSEWEVIEQLVWKFPELGPFLADCGERGLAPENVQAASDLLHGAGNMVTIALHLSIVVDVGEKFVKSCYTLEGDGFLAIQAFDIISELQQHCEHFAHPVTDALIRETVKRLPADVTDVARAAMSANLLEKAVAAVQPVVKYWKNLLVGDLAPSMKLFEACRLLNPARINDIPTDTVPQLLARFKPGVLNATTEAERATKIDFLMANLALYKARCLNLAADRDAVQWWRQNAVVIPGWGALAYKVALFQPSSASAERVFSQLKGMFDDDQSAALEDYRTAALQVHYNDLQRRKLEQAREVVPVVPVEVDSDSSSSDDE